MVPDTYGGRIATKVQIDPVTKTILSDGNELATHALLAVALARVAGSRDSVSTRTCVPSGSGTRSSKTTTPFKTRP